MSTDTAQSLPTTTGKGAFSLVPGSLHEAMEFSKIIANSDLVPKDYKGKPGNVLVAVQMGQELGLQPMQAIQNIAVINGRPTVWGDALLAIVMSQPSFVDINETFDETTETAICTVHRRGKKPKVAKFSKQDATAAGLTKKQGPWKDYPKRMMQMRARAFALRDAFADVLKGIQVAEEVNDYNVIDIESTEATAATEPAIEPATRTAAVADKLKGKVKQAPASDAFDVEAALAHIKEIKNERHLTNWYKKNAKAIDALSPEQQSKVVEACAKRKQELNTDKVEIIDCPEGKGNVPESYCRDECKGRSGCPAYE